MMVVVLPWIYITLKICFASPMLCQLNNRLSASVREPYTSGTNVAWNSCTLYIDLKWWYETSRINKDDTRDFWNTNYTGLLLQLRNILHSQKCKHISDVFNLEKKLRNKIIEILDNNYIHITSNPPKGLPFLYQHVVTQLETPQTWGKLWILTGLMQVCHVSSLLALSNLWRSNLMQLDICRLVRVVGWKFWIKLLDKIFDNLPTRIKIPLLHCHTVTSTNEEKYFRVKNREKEKFFCKGGRDY